MFSYRLMTATVLSFTASACLPADKLLLCRGDDDCGADEACEVVSGLCKPSAPPSRYLPELEAGYFGASGAFDCPIAVANQPPNGVMSPGRATVTVGIDVQEGRVCSESVAGRAKGDRPKITGLRTGCVVLRDPDRRVGPGRQRDYVELEFSQVDTTPSNPAARLKFSLRGDDAAQGELTVGEVVHGTFQERCQEPGGSTQLKLRAVVIMGNFEITGYEADRLQGRFDVKLALVEKTADRPFGSRCTLPRDCSDGCAYEELVSSECLSGTCIPQADSEDGTEGFCSMACESTADCDGGEDSLEYCLQKPNERFGQCIRICDPSGEMGTCPEAQTCREGTDFPDFLGSPGPARCLDECIPSPTAPMPPEHCDRPPPPDAGAPPNDGGSARPDGGDARDGGAPPPDGGDPRDGGTPRSDGGPPPPDGGPPPPDAGPPLDAGAAIDAGGQGAPLGLPCHAVNAPCPSGWVCGSVRLMATGSTGFCTQACPGIGQDGPCQAGYSGPGTPKCGLNLRNTQGGAQLLGCAVACGADFGGTDTCPSPMSCVDRVNNGTLMNPPDGRSDFCADP